MRAVHVALTAAMCSFVLSVVVRGGNTEGIIWLGGAIAAIALALASAIDKAPNPTRSGRVTSALCGLAFFLIVVAGACGVISFSSDTWLRLPGREAYRPITDMLHESPWAMDRFTLSIDLPATHRATLTALGSLAAFLGALRLPPTLLRRTLSLLLAVAVVEAFLGLLQLALGSPSFLAFGSAVGSYRASGTFVNKNHYATLLAMALPLLIRQSFDAGASVGRRVGMDFSRGWWVLASAVVASALISSLSRAGVSAGCFVSALALMACAAQATHRGVRWSVFVLLAVSTLILVAGTGLGAFVQSIQSTEFVRSVDGRLALNDATLAAANKVFPVGTGLGTFSIAFQRFQPATLPGFIEHAHNDYQQALFEIGIVGVVVIVLFALAWAIGATKTFRRALQRKPLSIAGAALLGCTAFAFHAWFDFPSHIPGLAWIAAFLSGVACRGDLSLGFEESRRFH